MTDRYLFSYYTSTSYHDKQTNTMLVLCHGDHVYREKIKKNAAHIFYNCIAELLH